MMNRREATKLVFTGIAAAISFEGGVVASRAQTKPVRLPLDEFVANERLLKALRKGVAAMKKRRPSDPLSWFFQASIHGVTDQLWMDSARGDSDVATKIDRAKYWNQCPHHGQNSANFLPWHRAYTHHFEQILRMHTDEDDFAVPYWDYGQPANRTFPREFGIQHLDGNTNNNDPANINPLYHEQRDYFLCGYEHPFTNQLPLTDLSARAVDTNRAMSSLVFFGETESTGLGGGILDTDSSTRGLLEQSPHDQIHRAVGGVVVGTGDNGQPNSSTGSMAIPMTAGFDPIFPVHHSNMDRLWMRWACMPGKTWGKLPDKAWFDESPWFFFDLDGKEVNRPRKDYFDFRALGVSFKDEDPNCQPLPLPPEVIGAATVATARTSPPNVHVSVAQVLRIATPVVADVRSTTAFSLLKAAEKRGIAARNFDTVLAQANQRTDAVTLTLHDVDTGGATATGFDVFLVPETTDQSALTPQSPGYVGQINLFEHTSPFYQSFDVTALVAGKQRSTASLKIVILPYSLSTEPKVSGAKIPFRTGAARIGRISLTKSDGATVLQNPSHRH
jgi:hypothetical protein